MSSSRAPPACVPTWRGHVESTRDALIIFEATLSGVLQHCIRRPHDRERNSLIVSGNVFVYEEGTSGIKRWTDGIPWSPSRILTNFLIYRQLNSPFPPGEKKRATKRSNRPVKPGEPYAAPLTGGGSHEDEYGMINVSPTTPGLKSEESIDKEADRVLVGSLVDSYEFKDGGLLKKTMTVTVNGIQHHLVSYYSLEDAKHNLIKPKDDSRFAGLQLREELLHQPKFKVQNIDDTGDGAFDQVDSQQVNYAYPQTSFQPMPQRSFPTPTQSYFSPQDQSHSIYYNGLPTYGHYASQVQTPISAVGFNSMPSTTSSYGPMMPTPTAYTHYPQQTQHQSPHHSQARPQRRTSGQIIKTEDHTQYQPQVHQQPQYQSNPQLHQLSYPDQRQLSQAHFQQQSPTDLVPRRGGSLNMFPNTHDGLGISNSFYPQADSVGPSMNDAALLLPHPMQMGFANQYGGNSDASYYSHSPRATS